MRATHIVFFKLDNTLQLTLSLVVLLGQSPALLEAAATQTSDRHQDDRRYSVVTQELQELARTLALRGVATPKTCSASVSSIQEMFLVKLKQSKSINYE